MIKTLYTWLVLIPLLAAVIIFSVNNKEPVVLSLWPLPYEIATPTYLIILISVLFGVVIGKLSMLFKRRKKPKTKSDKKTDAKTPLISLETNDKDPDDA